MIKSELALLNPLSRMRPTNFHTIIINLCELANKTITVLLHETQDLLRPMQSMSQVQVQPQKPKRVAVTTGARLVDVKKPQTHSG